MSPVEVITSVERRRRFSAQQKYAMVEEAELTGNSISIGSKEIRGPSQPDLRLEEAASRSGGAGLRPGRRAGRGHLERT